MRGKVRFWLGLALCGAGIAAALLAEGRAALYLLSGGLAVAGALLAVRHAHA